MRGIAGTVAAGLALLALVVLGAGVVGMAMDVRGPGAGSAVGHGIAAVLAVGGAALADRTRGVVAGVAIVGVVALSAATVWVYWLY